MGSLSTITPGKPKIRLPSGTGFSFVNKNLAENRLNTICRSGRCPNLTECWGSGTATFMISGDICTRSCRFCSVTTGKPLPPDPEEPLNLALSVKQMKLKHCVITSVDRDDLPDGGARHWAAAILKVREIDPGTSIEALIPDFGMNKESLEIVALAKPDIIAHNIETVEHLTPSVRRQAVYKRSLAVLRFFSEKGFITKSGLMTGLGETMDEIFTTIDDLQLAGCKIFTAGQYLQPTQNQAPVVKYYSDDEFLLIKEYALSRGFVKVQSGKLVRSSFKSEAL